MRDPVHPGEKLREELDALGMNAAALARQIDIKEAASSTQTRDLLLPRLVSGKVCLCEAEEALEAVA